MLPAKLQLDPARQELISGFVDSYLRLTMEEEKVFQVELSNIEPQQREQVMEIVTSWMEKGIEQGIEQGKRGEAQSLVLRMLGKRLGAPESGQESRIRELSLPELEELAEALLDFTAMSDLAAWLDARSVE